jgi:hypothetical protein
MPNIDAPTDFSAGGRRLSDRQWRNLLTDIHDGQVAVVVGSELSDAGTEQPSHLACRTALLGESSQLPSAGTGH